MTLQINPSFIPFFAPTGIAIVGASSDPRKLGFGLARNLVRSNFPGAAHFVNPRGGTLLKQPIYTKVADVPDPVDLAVLLIPAPYVAGVLAECGQRGIRAAIIASGGFRETGAEGAKLEEELVRTAREYDMRIIGPNCIGLLDTNFPVDTTFLPPPGPSPGDVAFISHSGAICAAVIDWARGQGFGLSRLVSLGNQADVQEAEILSTVAADPHTDVITLYLEGVSDGRRFVEEASRVTREKPIIALKVGRFTSGQRAVASHTGALAGAESAFNAAFRRAGVIRANTSEELFDWAKTLAWCPSPKGRNVAVLTNAGGPGVTAADALEAHGLALVDLQPETQAALQAVLPAAASVCNPVDMLASASPTQYAECLRILLADAEVHSVLVILPPPPMFSAGGVAKMMLPIIYASEKPVLIAAMGERMIQEAVEHFRAARIPEYRFPERAAAALAVLVQRAEYLPRMRAAPVEVNDVHPEIVRAILAELPSVSPNATGFLPEAVVERILCAYNIPFSDIKLARTAAEAVQFAGQMDAPVAMKVASADIPHKSDVGGVLLGLDGPEAVAQGFETIMRNAQTAHPEADITGINVQRMIPDGQEVIVGVVQDPQFGPVAMFGSGGVEVEGLKDVEFALAPLTQKEAENMLDNTWAGRKLNGYRNIPPADRAAALGVILRLGRLAADFPQIAEIELNPLRVLPEGRGVVAVDARARLG